MQPDERRVRKKKLAISYFDTAGDQTERLGEKKKKNEYTLGPNYPIWLSTMNKLVTKLPLYLFCVLQHFEKENYPLLETFLFAVFCRR